MLNTNYILYNLFDGLWLLQAMCMLGMGSNWGKANLYSEGGISLRKDTSVCCRLDLTGKRPIFVREWNLTWENVVYVVVCGYCMPCTYWGRHLTGERPVCARGISLVQYQCVCEGGSHYGRANMCVCEGGSHWGRTNVCAKTAVKPALV